MVISTPLIKAYARLGQKGAAAGIGMLEVAKSDPNLRVVVADSIAIASLDRFYANYPDKVINVGIAEQNMIGIAAGIASESGSNVFACTYAEFIITRTVEMIRQNLSYHQFNVKLIGNSAGFAMETLAVSHWATEDIALVRALPNIIILSASDCLAAIKLVIAASLIKGPVYLRLSGGLNCPIVYEKDCDFTIGKSNIIKKGEDVAILATGLMVREAMDAAEMLKEKNVNATVVDMYYAQTLSRKGAIVSFVFPLGLRVERSSVDRENAQLHKPHFKRRIAHALRGSPRVSVVAKQTERKPVFPKKPLKYRLYLT